MKNLRRTTYKTTKAVILSRKINFKNEIDMYKTHVYKQYFRSNIECVKSLAKDAVLYSRNFKCLLNTSL